MTARLLRAAVSFAAVLATYWLYALMAVPMIEPRAEARQEHTPPPKPLDPSGRYRELFAAYFPKGHWVYDRPKVLANDQTMLLIKDYTPLEGGRVELNPCLILFFPEPQLQNFKPQRQAVILDAPQGAVLQFEDGFDLSQAKIGRLIHGQLRGEISLRSDMKQPGPEDDLLVLTRDVQITESRIYTDHDVQFRVGANAGHGSELEIRLLQSTKPGGPTGMSISGLQSLRLARNVRMNLVMQSAGLLPGKGGAARQRAALPLPGSKQGPPPPVEITCRGPFIFDLVGYAATFEEQVDVLRLNPNGPSDQMTCEQLSVYFTPKTRGPEKAAPVAKKSPGGLTALEPTRLEAIGEPVVVRSPSTSAQARCQKLRYDLLSRTVELEATDEVSLLHGTSEIHAPALHYQPSEQPDGLGAVWASGPGWLRASPEKNPAQRFEARWGQELHLRKHEGTDVISLRGRPQLGVIGMGRITSDEFHLWLREATPTAAATQSSDSAAKGSKVEPDRMLATGDVQIESPQLNGATQRLEAWFAPGGALAPEKIKVRAQPAATSSSLIPARRDEAKVVLTAFRGPADSPAAKSIGVAGQHPAATVAQLSNPTPLSSERAPATASSASADSAAKSIYDLRGKLIRLQLALVGQQASVTDATIEGDVRLLETQTAKPDDKPLSIVGDRLQLFDAQGDASRVKVRGRPADVAARGMTMHGETIQLHRGQNRLWIDGPGTMTLPARRDLHGAATPGEQTFTVAWQEKMSFDGQVASFHKQVVGRGEGQLLQTELLEIELKEAVKFAGSSAKSEKAEVQRVSCREGVYLENRSVVDGKQTSIDRMQASDLSINQITGELFGQGPGWLTSVRLGGGDLTQPGAPPKPAAKPRPGEAEPEKFQFVHVDFRRAIEGNTIARKIHFYNDVRVAYGPVTGWDQTLSPDSPESLGDDGVLMSCDRLVLTEMPATPPARGSVELEALGNARFEGRQLNAQADRMAYAQAKELLVLEGTGRSDAQLWRQEQVGGPISHAAAKRILVWRSTGRVEVDGARFTGGTFTSKNADPDFKLPGEKPKLPPPPTGGTNRSGTGVGGTNRNGFDEEDFPGANRR